MLRLEKSDVHVWRVVLDERFTPRLLDWLAADERRRASEYRFASHRNEFCNARTALRHVLAVYFGIAPERVQFRYNEFGKPFVEGSVHFNVSHSGIRALIAVSRMRVGVDLERVDPEFDWYGVAQHFLPADEVDWIISHPLQQRPAAFFGCWTRHEAYVKARGTGLGTNAPSGLTDSNCEDGTVWTVTSLADIFPGYISAVAADAVGFTIRTFNFDELMCDGGPLSEDQAHVHLPSAVVHVAASGAV